MGFYCKQAVQKWLIKQGQSGQIISKLLLLIICPHGPVEYKPLLDSLFTVKPHD